ncbi:DUF2339 domain-containing protein [Deinococcus peraridilitoris]|uniref:Putative membrane protein n=1 Tax=Deinococcus peraridilitoris (strain DSM 19664 / LMG 22246 / CIP 109416 / KR-200) TaxID=937777 RepID=L0A1Y0_DEIPD|nr:DUF2339 domain-containing protein [Deinococcus peraridilitoris]AFZ67908.1 putative membrane protein [Deinococcus peraridilitoris DSM 19664]
MEVVTLLVVLWVVAPLWALISALNTQRRIGELEREVRQLRLRRVRPEAGASLPDPAEPAPTTKETLSGSAGELTQIPAEFAVGSHGPFEPAVTTETVKKADFGLGRWLTGFFSGPSAFARLGAVVLLVGVGLGLKYAADLGLLGLPLRLWGVVALGGALLVVGWRLRKVRAAYAAALMGTAFGVWYLTVFASLHFYGLLSTGRAFALLALLGGLLAALATVQRSQVLAVLGTLGGFLAPLLTSASSASGQANGVQLFAYYALLNVLALPLGVRFGWEGLPLLGFAATFGLATVWGVLAYRPDSFAVAEPFLLLFFLMYALLPLARARFGETGPRGTAVALLFATPVVFLSLQAALTGGAREVMALSCLGLSAFYTLLATRTASWRIAHAAIAVGALTLGLPFALGVNLTPAAWALEGAALAWYAARKRSRAWSIWSAVVQAGAGLAVLWKALGEGPPIALEGWGLAALLAMAALLSARFVQSVWPPLARAFAGAGMVWWLLGGAYGLFLEHAGRPALALLVVYVALSAVVLCVLGARWSLSALRAAAYLPLPVAIVAQLAWLGTSPLTDLGWLSVPVAVAAQLTVLEWRALAFPARFRVLFHALAFWFVLLILAWSAASAWGGVWALCAWGAVPALGVALIVTEGRRVPWIRRDFAAFVRLGVLPVLGSILVWFWLASGHSGRMGSWPVPLLNPLDLALAGSWYVAWRVLTRSGTRRTPGLSEALEPVWSAQRPHTFAWLLSVSALLGLSTAALRGVHFLGGVPWEAAALLGSGAVQTTLSLVWTGLGMGAMWWARRAGQSDERSARGVWLVGAVLLVAVTVKLFLVDLAGSSALARIVSFVSVGALLLLIGYLSPAPPRDRTSR